MILNRVSKEGRRWLVLRLMARDARKSALLTMRKVEWLYPKMLQHRVRGTILAAPERVGMVRAYFSSARILSAPAGVTGL